MKKMTLFLLSTLVLTSLMQGMEENVDCKTSIITLAHLRELAKAEKMGAIVNFDLARDFDINTHIFCEYFNAVTEHQSENLKSNLQLLKEENKEKYIHFSELLIEAIKSDNIETNRAKITLREKLLPLVEDDQGKVCMSADEYNKLKGEEVELQQAKRKISCLEMRPVILGATAAATLLIAWTLKIGFE